MTVGAICLSALLMTACADKNEDADKNTSKKKESSKQEVSLSAYDYYNDSSEEIISVESAESYDGALTASEALSIAEERGFDQRELTYDFDISGEYVGGSEASEGQDEKAPMYQTQYVTENGDVWNVYLIGDAVCACPISYIYEAELDYEIIFSESDSLISYDDTENKFYTTVPKESVVKLVVVDEINAETLENYTAEELEKI